MTRIPHHTNQFARRQQYGGWNWRNDQSQHPNAKTGSRDHVYSPQFLSPSYHYPSFFLFSGRPYIQEAGDCSNDQQFFDRMLQLSNPIKEHKKIIH
ncbi:hypothetical protein TNCV_1301141 [Trichonephila clavipes]|nr:hypothetical protein TNCV_1301141 [Trichonephila clavipes]